jgi:hypothetical protein
MNIYKLEPYFDDPKFTGFSFEDESSLSSLDSIYEDFLPISIIKGDENWQIPKLRDKWSPRKVIGKVRKMNDFPAYGFGIPILSERARDALSPLIDPHGEFLEVSSEIGKYWVFNVISKIDILDTEKSCIDWLAGTWIAGHISKYSFKKRKEDIPPVFRLKQQPRHIYATEKLKDAVEANGLHGFHFIPCGENPISITGAEFVSKDLDESVVLSCAAMKKMTKMTIAQIENELDSILYHPESTESVGHFEGHEDFGKTVSFFFSCPNARSLCELVLNRVQSLSSKYQFSFAMVMKKCHFRLDGPSEIFHSE